MAYHTVGTSIRGCSLGTWWLRTRSDDSARRRRGSLLLLLAAAAPAAAQESTFKPEVGQAGKDVVWVPTPRGDGRADARSRQGHSAGLRHRPGLGRRPQRHRRGQARRHLRSASSTTRTWSRSRNAWRRKPVSPTRRNSFRETCSWPTSPRPTSWRCSSFRATCFACATSSSISARARASSPTRSASRTGRADETVTVENCEQWCTAMLYIVPAKIGGTWQIGSDVLELKQEYQMLSGTLTSGVVSRLR